MDIKRYNTIKSKSIVVDNSIPKTSIPILNEGNYSEGYVTRYFLQMRDSPGSPIFEVDSDEYGKFFSNPYYKGISLNWRIIGKNQDSYEYGALLPSVTSSNRKAITEAAKEMPDIRMHLVNLTQFWKPLQ